MNNKSYDNNSLSSLKDEERVRKRPAVIFGSDGIEGAKHAFFEILSNSIDEAREGYGDKILIERKIDNSIVIEDFGRGIPLDYNENEKRYNWELVYLELYAGGKYNNNNSGSYKFSLGLNGLGACATQYASEFFDVEVKRDYKLYKLNFKKGKNIGGLHIFDENHNNTTGTRQHFKLDLEVFTDINIPYDYFIDVLKKQAIVNKGISFEFIDEIEEKSECFYYENGINDYIEEISENKEYSKIVYLNTSAIGKDREDKNEYELKAEIVFCFNNEKNLMEYFHNSSPLEYGGSPDKAIRTAFLSAIESEIKKQNKYLKNEKKIIFQDIQDSLIIIVNSFSTETSYENQTKKAITNEFIREYLTKYLKEQLEIYFIENGEETRKIIEQILINKRSRENSEQMKLNLKKTLSQKSDSLKSVKKFVDCRSKKVSEREIYIVEGDSALGACKLARNPEFQALIPVRGKILNCLKADYQTIFKSEIILDLIKVLGCGIEVKTKHNSDMNSFDINMLKYSKIIICTDADVDGYQIRTLILTLFYRLMPSLLKNGKVFIAESPLYEINTKSKTYFAYNELEKKDILYKIGNEKYKIQRSKGLGENEPEMMWQTTMNPKTRRLIKVEAFDTEYEDFIFNTLLGEDIDKRKKFIEDNGLKYIDMLDIS